MKLPATISLSMHAAFIAVFLAGGQFERRVGLGGLGPGDFVPVRLVGPEALRSGTPPARPPAPKPPEPKPVVTEEVEPPKPKPAEDGIKLPDEKTKPVAKPDTAAQVARREPPPRPAPKPAPALSPAAAALSGVPEAAVGDGGAVAAGIEIGLGGGGGGGGGGAFGEFSYYRLAMQNKVAANWSPGFVSGEAVCIIYFRIIRSGAVVGARVEESSGIPFYDQTALRAVLESSPFPPLPAQLPDDTVGVHFRFRYRP